MTFLKKRKRANVRIDDITTQIIGLHISTTKPHFYYKDTFILMNEIYDDRFIGLYLIQPGI